MDLEPKMEPKIGVLGALSPPDERGQPGGASSSVNGSGAGSVHPVMSGAHFGAPSGPLGPDSVIGAGLLGPGPHGPPPPPGLGISRSALEATCGSLQSVVGSLAAADTTSAGVNPGSTASAFMSATPGLGSQPGGQDSPGDRRRHWCVICGDRASGKHYGVFSCEGCKGFFKRTVRKDLTYNCRESRQCVIDRRQRNRCQYCRYEKCLAQGMRREAVQEERMRARERSEQQQQQLADQGLMDTDGNGTNNALIMPLEQILEAELAVEPENFTYVDVQENPVTNICHAADKQLFSLVEWSKRLPHFKELSIDDQVNLLKASWNELLIAAFSYRSTVVQDAILLATGQHVHRDAARQAGVGTIFDRILVELVAKMRDLKIDRTELGCLRAIVLFNPDAKGIASRALVERLREKVYSTLEEYCRTQYPEEPGRFAKLLLRLPALRSLGLKCLEHLFFFKLMGDTPIDTFLMEMLDTGTTMDD